MTRLELHHGAVLEGHMKKEPAPENSSTMHCQPGYPQVPFPKWLIKCEHQFCF